MEKVPLVGSIPGSIQKISGHDTSQYDLVHMVVLDHRLELILQVFSNLNGPMSFANILAGDL